MTGEEQLALALQQERERETDSTDINAHSPSNLNGDLHDDFEAVSS
jgi:hypothetical protein